MNNTTNINKIISCRCKLINKNNEKLLYIIPKPILSSLPIVFNNYKVSKNSMLDLSKILQIKCKLKVDCIETKNDGDIGVIKPDTEIVIDYKTELFWDLTTIPNEIYTSIGGYKNEINKMLTILYYIMSNEKNTLMSNGIMISGVSGIGKTFIIKEICKYLSIPLIEFNSMILYQGNEKINESIIYNGSVILIDDIDEIDDNISNTIIYYFEKMIWNELDNNKKIIIVGTCKDIYKINKSWISGNRLLNEIDLSQPNEGDRKEIIRIYLNKSNVQYNEDDINEISLMTRSYLPNDIMSVISETIISKYPNKIEIKEIKEKISKYIPTMIRNNNIFSNEVNSNIKFDDLGGLSNIIEYLKASIITPLQNTNYYKSIGVFPINGILLYGPSGCGKTAIINALTNETKGLCKFLTVNCTEILSKIVSESEHIISDLFSKARKISPCILFFDHLECIAAIRGNDSTSEKSMDRILSTLLTEMDGIISNTIDIERRIIIIGATNDLNQLDESILRAGRFDEHIFMNYPNKEEKIEIMKKYLSKIPIEEKLKSDLDNILDDFCNKKLFASSAELINLCKESVMREIREKEDNVQLLSEENLKYVLDKSLNSFFSF